MLDRKSFDYLFSHLFASLDWGTLSSYIINFCFKDCVPGFHGEKCQEMCGECKAGTVCNSRSGLCPDGCEDNWMLPNCTGLLIFKSLISQRKWMLLKKKNFIHVYKSKVSSKENIKIQNYFET